MFFGSILASCAHKNQLSPYVDETDLVLGELVGLVHPLQLHEQRVRLGHLPDHPAVTALHSHVLPDLGFERGFYIHHDATTEPDTYVHAKSMY